MSEQVAKSLAMQLAQAHLDKAFLEVRLGILLESVQNVLTTTQWVQGDNGSLTPVVATEPLQALYTLLSDSATTVVPPTGPTGPTGPQGARPQRAVTESN